MYRTDDPYRDFDAWEEEQAEEMKRLPVCSEWGGRIFDDFCYLINDEVICPICLEAGYRKEVDDYVS